MPAAPVNAEIASKAEMTAFAEYKSYVDSTKSSLFAEMSRIGASMGTPALREPRTAFSTHQPQDSPTTDARYDFASNTITFYPHFYQVYKYRNASPAQSGMNYDIDGEISHELGHALVDVRLGRTLESASQLVNRQVDEALATVVGMRAMRAVAGLSTDNLGVATSIFESINTHQGDVQAREIREWAEADIKSALDRPDNQEGMGRIGAALKRRSDVLLEQLDLYVLPCYNIASALAANRDMPIGEFLERMAKSRDTVEGLGGFFTQESMDVAFQRRRDSVMRNFDTLTDDKAVSGLRQTDELSYLLTAAATLLQRTEEMGAIGIKSGIRFAELKKATAGTPAHGP